MFDLKNICSWGGGVSCKLILSCVTLFTFINLLTWNIIYWIKTKQNTPPPSNSFPVCKLYVFGAGAQ